MNLRYIVITLLLFVGVFTHEASSQTKEEGIDHLRTYFSTHAYRRHELAKAQSLEYCLSKLQDDGRFSDLISLEDDIIRNKKYSKSWTTPQKEVSELTGDALLRVWRLSEAIQKKQISSEEIEILLPKLYKTIIIYGDIEILRGAISKGRFHISCFSIPTSAVNSYFCLFDLMEAAENRTNTDVNLIKANKILVDLSYQSWTQPYRNDETDKNVVSVERFRNHVWWVGGNALAYRSLLPTAAAMKSIPMMDVLCTVAQNALSTVSQNTIKTDFWTEGFTADGAGWGHGRQNIVWGYPIDGANAAIDILGYFLGTAWQQGLSIANREALINYIRGSSWFYYKGFLPIGIGRYGMNYNNTKPSIVKSKKIVDKLINKWSDSFSPDELSELKSFQSTAINNRINMSDKDQGLYEGTRWFYNNDDLVKKNKDYYIFINTASYRTDGTESDPNQDDAYNFYTDLGVTLFLKDGNEHYRSMGAWNHSSLPGTTVRQNVDPIKPRKNWSGYCSKMNYSGGATNGGENAVVGYELEVMDSNVKSQDIIYSPSDPNTFLYGVKAFKSYFIFGDYLLALGSNIDNMTTSKEGDIWTTIEQTAWEGDYQVWDDIHAIQNNNSSQTFTFDPNNTTLYGASQPGKFAYAVVPEWTSGEVVLKTESRSTKWKELNYKNRNRKDMNTTENIFHMYINHGRNVTNATYAYMVYSGNQSANEAFKTMPVNILDNSIEIQAAESTLSHSLGVVFHKTTKTLHAGDFSISTNKQVVLLLEEVDGLVQVTANDPTMDPSVSAITLTLNGNLWNNSFNNNTIEVYLPTDHDAGKPVKFTILESGETNQNNNSTSSLSKDSEHPLSKVIYGKNNTYISSSKQIMNIELFNPNGVLISQQKPNSNDVILKAPQKGIYIVKINYSNGKSETKKVIL
ncbi:T9SS type A sorting domain-containing protein [Halosquirtibacter xylanolyticus]|uniref:polysaccharide lyase family 8 super-sandwich domain-containing protein n=1 Tax=Halosquirtibacter xylanolyticus TaxID=3374599 RepID=UPI0037495493|nr:T9SS type A sorting domain-containing protein [Prolixibacteraceae bacterium]